jgi:tRNA (cmo5U34)-methyltransferase
MHKHQEHFWVLYNINFKFFELVYNNKSIMDKVEIFENQRASNYNQFVETWIPNYDYFIHQLPKLFSPMLNHNLLVAGCGTGNEIEKFVQSSKEWNITGVDPSPQMLNQAKERFEKFKNVTLVEGVVSDLDSDKNFDATTLLLVLHFLKDNGEKLNLLKNISERMNLGASFVLLDITGTKKQIKKNIQILKSFLPSNLDENIVISRIERIENKLYYISERRLTELLLEVGFDEPLRFFQSSIYSGYITKKVK